MDPFIGSRPLRSARSDESQESYMVNKIIWCKYKIHELRGVFA